MARYLAQIVVLGAQVVGRAFTRAIRQEFAAAGQTASRQRESGSNGGLRESVMDAKHGMRLQEAKQILNIENDKLTDIELINQKYNHLFDVNDKSKGGSFYIQSKVVRAKERIDEELRLKTRNKNSTHSETNEKTSHER